MRNDFRFLGVIAQDGHKILREAHENPCVVLISRSFKRLDFLGKTANLRIATRMT